MPDFVESPSKMIVVELLWSGIEDDVGLCGVADSAAFGVLACDVDGVDDGVREEGVACDGLVVHEPDVDDAAVWVDEVVRVLCVVL